MLYSSENDRLLSSTFLFIIRPQPIADPHLVWDNVRVAKQNTLPYIVVRKVFKYDVNLEGIKDEKVYPRLLRRHSIAKNLIHPFVLLTNFVIV
jgi:hypothetical protein